MDDEPNVVELRPKKPRGTSDPKVRAAGLAAAKISNHKPAKGAGRGGARSGLPAMGNPTALVSAAVSGVLTGEVMPPRFRTRDEMRHDAMMAMVAVLDNPLVDPVAKALVGEKLLNRLEGMPTQMTVTADMGDVSNLTADERAAEMSDLESRLGRA